MGQAIPRRRHNPLARLGHDRRAHPRRHALALVTLLLGALAALAALSPGLHLVGSWAGLLALLVGAATYMVSATTAERFLLVLGCGAAGFGLLMGMAHGGLFGGLVG